MKGVPDSGNQPVTFGVWLTAKHAASYLDFPSVNAFRMWASRHGVVPARRGKTLLFAKADLLTAIGARRKSA